MNAEDHARACELFHEACELAEDERRRFLDRACADAPELRAEVEALLAHDDTPSSFPSVEATVDRGVGAPSGSPPDRVGPYKILRLLGEGGMGTVYLALQEAPIRREVALKLIKLGMDTEQVVARFESERQALALMSHPNVSRVFDAGATDDGRPYFAMEFVKGEPISTYCDRQCLPTTERLDLFLQVCDGVQHAHQKGIIHRDLKPSNVLVEIQDGRPVPKIIDFGVSKATDRRLTERSVFTELGILIGTPEYMSPEQAELTALDVDTRTDVYSLGVMLYELLVGVRPFEGLREVAFDEIRRRIREEEPSKPSTRLSSLGDRSTDSARHRRVDSSTLQRQLRGDLDWITMRALEKNRTRRYGSPQELAADIRRHLEHLPVLAGPPSTAYRTRKFVARHRIGVTVAAAGVAAMLAFAATMAGLGVKIVRERDRANLEAETSRRVTEFLTEIFEVSDPNEAQGNTITARELLDVAAVRVDELADQPVLQARLMTTMGVVYRRLGLYAEAQPLLEAAVETHRKLLGPDDPATLDSSMHLAWLFNLTGRYEDAERMYRDLLKRRTRLSGDDDANVLILKNDLAQVLVQLGRYEEAVQLHEATLDARRRTLGDDHPDTLQSFASLGWIYFTEGGLGKAEPLIRRAADGRRRILGEDHPSTLGSLSDLAVVLEGRRRYDEASELFQQIIESRKRVLGEDHPATLWSMHNFATFLGNRGRYDEGEQIHREVLTSRTRILGAEHYDTLASMSVLVWILSNQQQYEEAKTMSRRAITIGERALGENHPWVNGTRVKLALMFLKQKRWAEAEQWTLRSLDANRKASEEESIYTATAMITLGRAYIGQRRFAEAEVTLRESLAIHERSRGPDDSQTLRAVFFLAHLSEQQERYDEAETLRRRIVETRGRVLGDDHPDTLRARNDLIWNMVGQERYAEAEEGFLDLLESRRRSLGEEHPDVAGSLYNLVCTAALLGHRDDAIERLREAVAAGFDGAIIYEDPDLASLRGDPEFEEILAEIRSRNDPD